MISPVTPHTQLSEFSQWWISAVGEADCQELCCDVHSHAAEFVVPSALFTPQAVLYRMWTVLLSGKILHREKPWKGQV